MHNPTHDAPGRHSGEPNSVITQLAFSPTKNLLAWTDNTGLFTRWQNPIPSSSPDPVKQPSAVLNAANASTRPASAALFGDSTNDDDVDVGGEIGQDGEDWIIDDLGIMEEGEEPRAGLVKEMGEPSCSLRSTINQ
jgi:chromosome transmission fidelity protein 4